jgi:hypothetical protein
VGFKEELRYRCCGVEFKRIVLQGHFPDKGCPKCGELPEDYTTLAQWYEDVRGHRKGKLIYTYGGPDSAE